jgi:hypothetical protein
VWKACRFERLTLLTSSSSEACRLAARLKATSLSGTFLRASNSMNRSRKNSTSHIAATPTQAAIAAMAARQKQAEAQSRRALAVTLSDIESAATLLLEGCEHIQNVLDVLDEWTGETWQVAYLDDDAFDWCQFVFEGLRDHSFWTVGLRRLLAHAENPVAIEKQFRNALTRTLEHVRTVDECIESIKKRRKSTIAALRAAHGELLGCVAELMALVDTYRLPKESAEQASSAVSAGDDGTATEGVATNAQSPGAINDDYQPASWFIKKLSARLRMAAKPGRRTKRVKKLTVDGVVLYCVSDARKWWSRDVPADRTKA